jgi:hypothetical protein
VGATLGPPKDDPPLVVDPNAVEPTKIAPEGLQPIARRRAEVVETSDGVQHIKLAKCSGDDVRRNPTRSRGAEPVVKIRGRSVAEGRNQLEDRLPITRLPCNRKAG